VQNFWHYLTIIVEKKLFKWFFSQHNSQKIFISIIALTLLNLSSCAIFQNDKKLTDKKLKESLEKIENLEGQLQKKMQEDSYLENKIADQMRNVLKEEVLPSLEKRIQQDVSKIISNKLDEKLATRPAFNTDISKDKSKKLTSAQEKASRSAKQKIILGRIEWVRVGDANIPMQARVDTGAKTTSIHATNIKEEMINGVTHVRFDTYDDEGNIHTLLRPILSQQKVISTSGKTNRRYVIREKILIGGTIYDISVNLHNRGKLKYNFLIGRNLLIGRFIVDVSLSYVFGRSI